MKYHSDDSNDKRPLAAYIAIALVVVFCLIVLITGAKVTDKAEEVAQAAAEILATPQPTPSPQILVVEQKIVETEFLPILEKVVVEVPVPQTTYVQVPVDDSPRNSRYASIELSTYDLHLLACIAWREARGEKSLGMRMVVEVVLNRVLSSQFPDTVYGVLYQPGQFQQGEGVLGLDEITPTQAQYDAVTLALTETPITDADVYFFATSALTDAVFMRVGGHYFCKNGKW